MRSEGTITPFRTYGSLGASLAKATQKSVGQSHPTWRPDEMYQKIADRMASGHDRPLSYMLRGVAADIDGY